MDAYAYSKSATGNPTVKFYGGNLVLDEYTKIRMYFDNADGYTFTYKRKVNGTEQTIDLATRTRFGHTYVEIPNVGIQDLNTMWEVTATKGSDSLTVKYSGLTYIRTVLFGGGEYSQSLKDMLVELYHYHVKAKTYFDNRT